jgi:hypothetical protein
MYRAYQNGGALMAYLEPTDSSPFGSVMTDTISYALVDNSQYAYYLNLTLPATTLTFKPGSSSPTQRPTCRW